MATKLVGPIQFQGKLGTIVGRATRKGNISVGMAPTKYTNPNTPAQIKARNHFLAVTNFTNAVPMSAFAGMTKYAKSGKMSVRNAAFKFNMAAQRGNWFQDDVQDGNYNSIMNKPLLAFSRGVNTPAANMPEQEDPGAITLTMSIPEEWKSEVPVLSNCIHHVIIYIPDAGVFIHKAEQANNNGIAQFSISYDQSYIGLSAHVYGYTQFWGDDVDYTYVSPADNTSARAIWAAENAKTEFTKTMYIGQVSTLP